ncbi:protein-serine/threonine phosphatase [Ranunculus cassubicifolius]
MVFRKQKNFNAEKKLLVLDMDETLIHARQKKFTEEADFSFTLVEDNTTFYVKLRPGVRSFLENAANMFDVMIFTSSEKEYADQIIDFLDPKGSLISRRAYRDSGKTPRDGYVKDLTVLEHDLAKVIIIDNDRHYFRLQKDNGIPIKAWYGDVPLDQELPLLLPFLAELVVAEDVRSVIAAKFGIACSNMGKSNNKKKTTSNATPSVVKPVENPKSKGGKKNRR